MATWICLLRGVNLGATNKINMAALRTALTDAGMINVRTYLQSGNVIVDSDLPASKIAALITEVIKDNLDLEIPVIVRTPEQLRQLAQWCPYREEAMEGAIVHLMHLAAQPDQDRVAELIKHDWSPDELAVDQLDVAIKYATSMHKSRLQHSTIRRRLGVDGTARNWKTLQALINLTADT